MEEEKVIHSTVEKELMSLAHDILRNRRRMDIDDIHRKALAIIELTTPKTSEEKEEVDVVSNNASALEKALQQPVKEAVFETIETPFAERLFEGNNADYQRVMSMLKSKKNAEEAKAFIENQIQPDYDWSTKQTEVEAFLNHVEAFYDQQH